MVRKNPALRLEVHIEHNPKEVQLPFTCYARSKQSTPSSTFSLPNRIYHIGPRERLRKAGILLHWIRKSCPATTHVVLPPIADIPVPAVNCPQLEQPRFLEYGIGSSHSTPILRMNASRDPDVHQIWRTPSGGG